MAWEGDGRRGAGDSDVHALSYEGMMARTLTGQMAGPGKRGREGRRVGEMGFGPVPVFPNWLFSFLAEKRREGKR